MKSFKQKSEGFSKIQSNSSKKTPKSSETSLKVQNTTNSKESIPIKQNERDPKGSISKPRPIAKNSNDSSIQKQGNASEDNFYDAKNDNQSGNEKNHDNEISLLAPNNTSAFNPQISNILNKMEDEKNSEANLSEPEEKSSIQKLSKSEPKNEYLAKLEQANKDKKEKKEKAAAAGGGGGVSNIRNSSIMNKEVSDKEDKSPFKPPIQQKITITKNAMKNKDPNKIDYGVGGMDEGSSPVQMNVPQDIFNQAGELNTRNIKVCARFRPCNRTEEELVRNNLGKICVSFPEDGKSVVIKPSNDIYTLDKVYNPLSLQSVIYEEMAKEIIEDVLTGYNGTIFAYGQTGSGKTHTMYGNLHDDENKGIIPRAAQHIFDFIDKCEYDVEYTIEASMLEIYRETLNDLLAISKTDLKIKEDPQKGIHVGNLTQVSIGSCEELMKVLEIGDQTRTVKATRMNEYSSRSHTLFTIDVVQRFPNSAEKRGKLNLIDLAGSEKISKSGAAGETLEEAKKINLSLSALGHVIKSLTTDAEHIPYRDSKLTRILQDSLGGNFKTNLIVTGSPHSSQVEETISTLKFATRAKTIKLAFKMNLKNSPDQMNRVVGTMKEELKDTKEFLNKFKFVAGKIRVQLLEQIEHQEQLGITPSDETNKILDNLKSLEEGKLDTLNEEEFLKAQENQENQGSGLGEENKDLLGLDSSGGLMKYGSRSKNMGGGFGFGFGFQMPINPELMGFNPPLMNEFLLPMEEQSMSKMMKYLAKNKHTDLLKEKYNLAFKLKSKEAEISSLNSTVEEKESQINKFKEHISELKKELLLIQKDCITLKERERNFEIKLNEEQSMNRYLKFQIEILEKQINKLTSAVTACDSRISDLLREKCSLINIKFEEYLKTNLEFHEIKLVEYINNSINFGFEKATAHIEDASKRLARKISLYADTEENSKEKSNNEGTSERLETDNKSSFIQRYDFKGSFLNEENYQNIIEFPGKIEVLASNLHTPISQEFTIFLLKKQLINANIINQHLARCICSLEWKQAIEYGKAKIKANLTELQNSQIKKLEKVLEKAREDQKNLKNRIEDVELDELDEEVSVNDGFQRMKKRSKTKILKTCRRDSNIVDLQISALKVISEKDNDDKAKNTFTDLSKTDLSVNQEVKSLKQIKKTNDGKIDVSHTDLKNEEDDMLDKAIELIEKENLPLTYENAIAVIKRKNEFIKNLGQNRTILKKQGTGETGAPNPNDKNNYNNEIKRLHEKIKELRNELRAEKDSAEYFQSRCEGCAETEKNIKKLNEEIEMASRENLKAENFTWQRAMAEVNSINEKELSRRHSENKKLIDVLNIWMSKITELVNMKQDTQTMKKFIDLFYSEASKARDQILNKSFVGESNSGLGSNRNSFSESNNNLKQALHFNNNERVKTPSLTVTPNKLGTQGSVVGLERSSLTSADIRKK